MYLLLDTAGMQQLLSRDECEEVKTMAVYVAQHYLPAMCQAKYSAASPHNLITNIYNLRLVREESPVAAGVALAKWEQHLNWLSPELVAVAIFHPGMAAGEREAMTRKLYSFRDGWQPGQNYLYQFSLLQFPNSTSGSQDSPIKNTDFWGVWGVSGNCLVVSNTVWSEKEGLLPVSFFLIF